MAYHIVNVKAYAGGEEAAAVYIHSKWGSPGNLPFYLDAVRHSVDGGTGRAGLPRFYLLLRDRAIVGCYALLVNDFISRHDLMPWLACLFVEASVRGQRLSGRMFAHAQAEARQMGFPTLYLTTDHTDLYERFGWTRMADGYDPSGQKTRIYCLEAGLMGKGDS